MFVKILIAILLLFLVLVGISINWWLKNTENQQDNDGWAIENKIRDFLVTLRNKQSFTAKNELLSASIENNEEISITEEVLKDQQLGFSLPNVRDLEEMPDFSEFLIQLFRENDKRAEESMAVDRKAEVFEIMEKNIKLGNATGELLYENKDTEVEIQEAQTHFNISGDPLIQEEIVPDLNPDFLCPPTPDEANQAICYFLAGDSCCEKNNNCSDILNENHSDPENQKSSSVRNSIQNIKEKSEDDSELQVPDDFEQELAGLDNGKTVEHLTYKPYVEGNTSSENFQTINGQEEGIQYFGYEGLETGQEIQPSLGNSNLNQVFYIEPVEIDGNVQTGFQSFINLLVVPSEDGEGSFGVSRVVFTPNENEKEEISPKTKPEVCVSGQQGPDILETPIECVEKYGTLPTDSENPENNPIVLSNLVSDPSALSDGISVKSKSKGFKNRMKIAKKNMKTSWSNFKKHFKKN